MGGATEKNKKEKAMGNISNFAVIVSSITALIAIIVLWRSSHKDSREQGQREGRVDAFMEKVEQFMGEMKEEITQVKEDIKKIFQQLPPAVDSENSPRILTDLGRLVSVDIGATAWAKAQVNEGGLWRSVGDSPPYQVQELSFNYVEEFKPSNDLYRKWQEAAYNHGIDISQVKRVLALELRDALFEHQKEEGIYNLPLDG